MLRFARFDLDRKYLPTFYTATQFLGHELYLHLFIT
jgi:hypothetical protein